LGISKSVFLNNKHLCVAQLVETMTMGGAENLAVRIANALAAEGHQSHLIVVTEPDILSERIHPDVHVHYLEFWRSPIRNPFAFLASILRGLRLLKSVIENEKIQVVQTHLPGANFWGLLLELNKVLPVLATIHNNQEFRYGDRDNQLLAFFRKTAYKQILNRCHGTVAVSEKVRNSLIQDLGIEESAASRISVVNNGVEIPQLLSSGEIKKIRTQLNIDEEKPLVLAAGRFSEQKNFGDLIDAAAILRDRGESFQLVIGGDGEQRAVFQDRVRHLELENLVSLPGNLVNLNKVMLAADVYTMSSLWEGLPLVLLEAMATGLPAVAYGIPGVDELIASGENGIVAKVGSPESLADGLAVLLGDPVLREKMGHTGRLMVEKSFSFSHVINELENLYLSVRV